MLPVHCHGNAVMSGLSYFAWFMPKMKIVSRSAAHRAAARYLWAVLLARICAVLPLICPFCQTPMRIIALVHDPGAVHQVLAHLSAPTRPPRIAPARGPPLWEAVVASRDPAWDHTLPPPPDLDFDQRITW